VDGASVLWLAVVTPVSAGLLSSSPQAATSNKPPASNTDSERCRFM
jgi:hypothetical protein